MRNIKKISKHNTYKIEKYHVCTDECPRLLTQKYHVCEEQLRVQMDRANRHLHLDLDLSS